MHRLITLFAFLFLAPLFTFAQTSPNCLVLERNMEYGTTDSMVNGEVTKLQDFLRQEGFFTETSTGNFYSRTQQAVLDFQAAYSIQTTGYVGPLTRAKIEQITCSLTPPPRTGGIEPIPTPRTGGIEPAPTPRTGGIEPVPTTPSELPPRGALNETFDATPSSGGAPLTVSFNTNRLGTQIDFGDGTSKVDVLYQCMNSDSATMRPRCSVLHTYATAGTYTARLLERAYCFAGMGDGCADRPLATKSIVVSTGGGTGGTSPTCTLTATPAAVASGGSVTLTWTTTNATQISITPGTSSAVSPSGSRTEIVNRSTVYTLTAGGAGGTVQCERAVTVSDLRQFPLPYPLMPVISL